MHYMADDRSKIPADEIPPRGELRYTARFSEEFLRRFRNQGDPLADAVAAKLAQTKELTDIHDLLTKVRKKAAVSGGAFQAFLDETRRVPEWVNFNMMERGQRILIAYDPIVRIALSFGSLLGVGGQFPKMGDVVRATGVLDYADYENSSARLQRTGDFIIGLATPGELRPGRFGHDGILKIRLLHAAVRQYVVGNGQYKEVSEIPVNQHDLAITLALFGYIAARSLRRLGVWLCQDDVVSYTHLWRYVGFVLGIDSQLLPETLDMQQEFFLASTLMMGDDHESSGAAVRDGLLISAARASDITWGIVPAKSLHGLMLHLMSHLAGDEYLSGMGVAEIASRRSWFSCITLRIIRLWSHMLSAVDHGVPFGLGSKFLFKVHMELIRLGVSQPRAQLVRQSRL